MDRAAGLVLLVRFLWALPCWIRWSLLVTDNGGLAWPLLVSTGASVFCLFLSGLGSHE